MNSSQRLELSYGILLFGILLSTVGLYWAGLHSIFLLDDHPTLSALSHISAHNFWPSTLQMLAEGDAGALGRPISLFTFALQYQSWPYDAWAFKYVNLMIHLLNGCLIFWLLLHIGRIIKFTEQKTLLISGLVTAVWLIHPLNVSTVLYSAQRMTQLSSLFMLVGLVTYLTGRTWLGQGRYVKGYSVISIAIVVGGLFATLSKENGVLLLLYVLVLEATVLKDVSKPPYWRTWQTGFLFFPLALLLAYIISRIPYFADGYKYYGFSLQERLLTEPRILLDYIAKILLLNPGYFGLFHDDYLVSHNLFTPPSTVLSIFIVVSSFVGAWLMRKRHPLVAFGILWFCAGHALESTAIPLFLYFEHRNYLPMVGILFFAIYTLNHALSKLSPLAVARYSVVGGIIAWLSFFPLVTWSETQLWGNPFKQTMLWAKEHPKSRQAQSHAANILEELGNYQEAARIHTYMAQAFPNDIGPHMFRLELACKHPEMAITDFQPFFDVFQHKHIDIATVASLNVIIGERSAGHCQLPDDVLEKTLTLLINNKNHIVTFHYALHRLLAEFYAQQQHYSLALESLDHSLALRDEPRLRFKKIIWLMLTNQRDEALAYLQETRKQWSLFKQYVYQQQLNMLEKQLEAMNIS